MAMAMQTGTVAPVGGESRAFMPWSESFSLGIRLLDNDHRQLFDIINTLHQAVLAGAERRVVGGILDALVSYTEGHFEREEAYLARYGYPERDAHMAEHRRLTGVVYGLKRQFDQDADKIIGRDVLTFLKTWLEKHILGSDMAFAPYLRGEKGTLPRATATTQATTVEMAENVPADKVELLQACAAILREGGYKAFALEDLVRKA